MSKSKKTPARGGFFSQNRVKILCLTVALVLLAGTASWFLWFSKKDPPPVKMTIAAPSDVMAYFNDNGLTPYFEEKQNISIQWIDYGAREGAYERVKQDVNLDPADRPDAYMGFAFTENEMAVLAPELFLDLTDRISQDAPVFQQVLASDTSRLREIRLMTRVYSFPSLTESFADEYPQKVWVNAKWMAQMGAKMPTTTDEFYDLLVAMKTQQLDGAETTDKVPLGVAYMPNGDSSLGFLVNAFLTCDYDLSSVQGFVNVDNGGKLYAGVVEPEFKEALKFIQRLFKEELIDANAFTNGKDTLIAGGSYNDVYGVIAAPDLSVVFNDVTRAASYVPLPPLKGPHGQQSTLTRRIAAKPGALMIGKDSKVSATVFALGDMMLSEAGTLSAMHGPQDKGWAPADTRVLSMGGTTTSWKKLDGALQGPPAPIPMWYDAALAMRCQATADANGSVDLQTAANWSGYLAQVTREVYEPVGRNNVRNAMPELVLNDSQEARLAQKGDVRRELMIYLSQTCQEFVTTDADIDAEFDGFVQELNDKGLGLLLELLQESYDRYQ